MEMMSSTEFGFLLACVILVGLAVVWLYRRFYEYQINRILEDSTRKCRLPEVRNVMIGYLVIGIVFLLVCVINSISYSKSTKESCYLSDSVVGFNLSDEDLEKELIKLQYQGDVKSFTLQEDKLNDHIRVLYAIRNKEEYMYVITYQLNREVQKDEYIYLSAVSGYMTQKLDEKHNTIRIFLKGKVKDVDCERTTYKMKIQNYTKGVNRYPIDEVIEFTVENGGIQYEK